MNLLNLLNDIKRLLNSIKSLINQFINKIKMKVLNFLLNLAAVIALFTVSITIVEIVCVFAEIPQWLSFIIYFGTGIALYHPIRYIFKH